LNAMSNRRTAFQAPMQQERIREILEPLWNTPFRQMVNMCSLSRVGSKRALISEQNSSRSLEGLTVWSMRLYRLVVLYGLFASSAQGDLIIWNPVRT
jgi:hypothetical protein